MPSFTELLTDVYSITNRPDLTVLSKTAIRAATLKAHHLDFFPKDLFETGISWATPDFLQSLDYRTLIPRYRSLKFLRKYNNSTPGDFFDIIIPELILDDYGYQRENVCYLAGANLEIRSNTEDAFMILGCYRHPDTTELSYDSWIAFDHPWAIVYEAAANVFKQIGYDEQFQGMQQMALQEYLILRQEVVAKGE